MHGHSLQRRCMRRTAQIGASTPSTAPPLCDAACDAVPPSADESASTLGVPQIQNRPEPRCQEDDRYAHLSLRTPKRTHARGFRARQRGNNRTRGGRNMRKSDWLVIPNTSHAPELNNLFLRLSSSAEVTAERASQILTGNCIKLPAFFPRIFPVEQVVGMGWECRETAAEIWTRIRTCRFSVLFLPLSLSLYYSP